MPPRLGFGLTGSPPRVRGKVPEQSSYSQAWGITPACAGKRRRLFTSWVMSRDHPRVCGEKVSSTSPIKCLKGSPPRMRGKVDLSLKVVRVLGITPACAGKSCPFLRRTSPRRDHPRVCGEKRSRFKRDQNVKGSPPRMRGKVDLSLKVVRVLGITPACAGKRRSVAAAARSRRDHPRVCGEKAPE